jgi:hypothetical protein
VEFEMLEANHMTDEDTGAIGRYVDVSDEPVIDPSDPYGGGTPFFSPENMPDMATLGEGIPGSDWEAAKKDWDIVELQSPAFERFGDRDGEVLDEFNAQHPPESAD